MDENKRKQIAFWQAFRAVRDGKVSIVEGWNGDEKDALLQRIQKHISEGLMVYQPTTEPPRVPYPEPIQVGDPLDLRKARIKALHKIFLKEIELAYNMLLTLDRLKNPQMQQLLAANYNKQLAELDKTWRAINVEIVALSLPTASVGE